jgi:hypothetical protein
LEFNWYVHQPETAGSLLDREAVPTLILECPWKKAEHDKIRLFERRGIDLCQQNMAFCPAKKVPVSLFFGITLKDGNRPVTLFRYST